MTYLLSGSDLVQTKRSEVGGKGFNLCRLMKISGHVPEFAVIKAEAFQIFSQSKQVQDVIAKRLLGTTTEDELAQFFTEASMPLDIQGEIASYISQIGDGYLAVRSSGTDEDGGEHSYAGQFSSFLFQKGISAIEESVKRCWASAFSERVLSYRRERGLSNQHIEMAVVLQKMIDPSVSGVLFTRHPIRALARDRMLISAVYGVGEGIVSGYLAADEYDLAINGDDTRASITSKQEKLVLAANGTGLETVKVSKDDIDKPTLRDHEIDELRRIGVQLETALGGPQDIEWCIAKGKLYLLQTRPITSLPPDAYYDAEINGRNPTLWDNSNIIESYSGVTSPLTFSFASRGYTLVYLQFARIMGTPESVIAAKSHAFRNMLGSIRGRVYYNLAHWYELVQALPGAKQNREFMDTMMGVKAHVSKDLEEIFSNISEPTYYSPWAKLKLLVITLYRWRTIDQIVARFFAHFNPIYQSSRTINFKKLSLKELKDHYDYLEEHVSGRWEPPLINDFICMVFFGVLKKLSGKWLTDLSGAEALQNDLLCGEGGLESTEPTKFLMKLAGEIDQSDLRGWFVGGKALEVVSGLRGNYRETVIAKRFEEFLDRYGFRSVNELKLEEPDLHEDPSFVITSLQGYLKTKSYDLSAMADREQAIRLAAEVKVKEHLRG